MSFIKELVGLVHNINLFDYEFVELTKPNDCGEYLVILKYKYTAKSQYVVHTLPYLVWQIAINSIDGGTAAKKLAKEIGDKNMIKYYKDLLDKNTTESDYYNQKIRELKGEN